MWPCPEQIYFVLQVAKCTLILGKAKEKRKSTFLLCYC